MLVGGRFILAVLLIAAGMPRLACCCTASPPSPPAGACPRCTGQDGAGQHDAPPAPCRCPQEGPVQLVATQAVPVVAVTLSPADVHPLAVRPLADPAPAAIARVRHPLPRPPSLSIPLLLGHLLF